MDRLPYIGVAGFVTVPDIHEAILATPYKNHLPLAIGILTSSKTINGTPNKYPHRYPKVEDVPTMISESRELAKEHERNVLFVLHYSTDTLDNFEEQIRAVGHVVARAAFDGVQINVPPHFYHHPTVLPMLDWLARWERVTRIIAQVRPSRGIESWTDLIGVGLHIAKHASRVTDLLLDASGGTGNQMNLSTTSDLITAIRGSTKHRDRLNINVAGGLTPKNLVQLETLFRLHGLLGFDIETGVRDADDQLSIGLLREYLREAYKLAR